MLAQQFPAHDGDVMGRSPMACGLRVIVKARAVYEVGTTSICNVNAIIDDLYTEIIE